ncbi:DNA ligase D [Dokdonella sp.]|uniref:DNA ligase D n=1 Tax=Dokdonella sp. TaxID=2291710 RepID=UPI001B08E6B5|nr:DNA ligase D [Dokdonella sp.]MBO9662889.1 DNA ligase D [Dokdonella sp.]
MSLREYARKRRFDETPEPAAPRKRAKRAGGEPIFVVQLHHARARHYDFRLEVDGTLKSWAVPKGPSLRPGEKRLAVEVEDHPLPYANFEGDIPQGHYGAGHVAIFDRGTWRAEGRARDALAAGHLDFALDGERLRGRWTLVRTRRQGRQQQWLLFKRNDEEARDAEADDLLDEAPATPAKRPARRRAAGKTANETASRWHDKAAALPGARRHALPAGFAPQLCSQQPTAPRGENWLHESKWDGYRLLADLDGGKVRLRSRNDLDWTDELPEIASAIEALPVASARLDGEMVALDRNGRSDFSALQQARKSGATQRLRYQLFDLPALEGVDLTRVALIERKELLEALLKTSRRRTLGYSSHVLGHGREVFEAARRQGLEGIVSKRIDAPYVQARSSTWVKVKHANTDEFVVVGYTAPKGSRSGFGALLMAAREGRRLRYVGRVGTGFDDETLRSLLRRLQPLRRRAATIELPAHVPLRDTAVQWVEPTLVAEVEFRGWAKEGLLRQASFLRLREDKSVEDLDMSEKRTTKPARGKRSTATGEVTITHPERVVYADAGYVKQDVADYYRAVAARLLPEIAGRPLSILRCPDGAGGTCFFQKHHAGTLGAHVRSVRLREKSGGSDHYLYVEDEAGLLELVQMNVLEFHPWGSRIDDPDRPDRLVFDLDPDPGIGWPALVAAARDVRRQLTASGLESFVRLSGGKGVHVVVPIARGPRWEEAKAFCEAFADAMATRAPQTYVATASKAKRRDRIFIDWLRNARGATSVASWSLRARAGAPVAMPLRWPALAAAKGPAAYDLEAAKRRARTLREDPWGDLDALAQTLPTLD